MKHVFQVIALASIAVLALLTSSRPATSEAAAIRNASSTSQDFDFEFGTWRVHHRVKSKTGDGTWKEFDGTARDRPLMNGASNIEEHTFFRPEGQTYGVALRAFDAKTGEWAIWWLDSRAPHLPMDPPVKGHFEQGVGAFYSDSEVAGKVIRTRYIWSHITKTAAQWEQALSSDAGKTWETNWIMQFERVD
jgi:hypothetical protein